jgi:hypothetical protein
MFNKVKIVLAGMFIWTGVCYQVGTGVLFNILEHFEAKDLVIV